MAKLDWSPALTTLDAFIASAGGLDLAVANKLRGALVLVGDRYDAHWTADVDAAKSQVEAVEAAYIAAHAAWAAEVQSAHVEADAFARYAESLRAALMPPGAALAFDSADVAASVAAVVARLHAVRALPTSSEIVDAIDGYAAALRTAAQWPPRRSYTYAPAYTAAQFNGRTMAEMEAEIERLSAEIAAFVVGASYP